jgi:hypothetical protein
MVESLTVNIGERSYPIRFGADLIADVRAEIAGLNQAGRKVAVLTDANVAQAQAQAGGAMFGDMPLLVIASRRSRWPASNACWISSRTKRSIAAARCSPSAAG